MFQRHPIPGNHLRLGRERNRLLPLFFGNHVISEGANVTDLNLYGVSG